MTDMDRLPNSCASAQETTLALWKGRVKLAQFSSWQTNFPGSRPELVPEIEQLMASISAVCEKLEPTADD